MYKLGICGHFGTGQNLVDGQSIKTNIFKNEVGRILGNEQIKTLDTHKWKKNPLLLLVNSISLFFSCEKVAILPGQNGLKVILPFFLFLSRVFKKEVHYIVIGGWLPDFLQKNNKFLKYIKKIKSIHVESHSMIRKLNEAGIDNVFYMPNIKRLNYLSEEQLVYEHQIPYKLCTFSRVIKEKGIENAIDAVTSVNNKFKKKIYTLDIYGPIDESYKQEFAKVMENVDDSINYKGVISYDNTVSILKDYYLLLFPTYYSGEGFAGTLLDSLASGVPIIASDWRYNSEIVKDGVTGFVYSVNKPQEMITILENIIDNPHSVISMKRNCLREYKKYDPTHVVQSFLNIIYEGAL
ncbi:glycosyltransferase family 4 protein [Paenibacillus gallinarum]|uniref:Glycosyltransferase n=1 Tax=Paenibacillus gallinarum TaxID=2762232 RepID=A0ABR8T486_9BACL|nr:glycosyltransferase [Paenibacillus gallinarum]MBD7970571.1 glycosyltransferase [Paenibacillus gallinarum]